MKYFVQNQFQTIRYITSWKKINWTQLSIVDVIIFLEKHSYAELKKAF